MAYIGQGIKNGTFTVLDTSGNTYNGSNVTFDLGTQVGSPAQLLVSHDGVIQKPVTDYILASGGTQITFTTAPASGASIFITEISGAVGAPMNRDLNGDELILDADGDTSITADTDDQIDFRISGADDLRMTANAINVLSGTTLTIDSGATITNSGTANGFGTDPDGAQVFNESGAAVDFRVEGDTDTHLLMVDGSGDKVGIGEDVPEAKLHVMTGDASVGPNSMADELIIEGSGHTGMSILSGTSNQGGIYFGDSGDDNIGYIAYNHNGNTMHLATNAVEVLRLNAGSSAEINPGAVAHGGTGFFVYGASNNTVMQLKHANTSGDEEVAIIFKDGSNTTCGTVGINTDANQVTYNTSSDYRLKENETAITDGITRVKQLKPYRFNFKSDEDTTVDGFFAHEVSSIIPEAVNGKKDETETIKNVVLDSSGKIIREEITEETWKEDKEAGIYASNTTWSAEKTDVIKPQSMDYGRITPLLTAALKEAITKIETLETKVKALEDA